LFGLLLHPGDHSGDRVAGVMVSALIVVTTYQMDLGLGRLTYLIWFDIFNLVQLVTLMVVLLEVLYVHRLVSASKEEEAKYVDSTCLLMITMGIYPVVLVALICFGFERNNTGIIVLVVGIVTVITLGGTILEVVKRRIRSAHGHLSAISQRRIPTLVKSSTPGDAPAMTSTEPHAYTEQPKIDAVVEAEHAQQDMPQDAFPKVVERVEKEMLNGDGDVRQNGNLAGAPAVVSEPTKRRRRTTSGRDPSKEDASTEATPDSASMSALPASPSLAVTSAPAPAPSMLTLDAADFM